MNAVIQLCYFFLCVAISESIGQIDRKNRKYAVVSVKRVNHLMLSSNW